MKDEEPGCWMLDAGCGGVGFTVECEACSVTRKVLLFFPVFNSILIITGIAVMSSKYIFG